MASISDIIAGAPKEKGKRIAGAWRVSVWTNPDKVTIAELWHYSTLMLRWNTAEPTDESILDYSLGYGSVSDQNGMNIAFRMLGLGLYFSRAGGAEIVERDPLPMYLQSHTRWIKGQRVVTEYSRLTERPEGRSRFIPGPCLKGPRYAPIP